MVKVMARLTDKDREQILADFHTGQYTNRAVAEKYEVTHVTIGKVVKGVKPKYKELVTTQVAINTELAEASIQEVTSVTNEVTKLTRYTNLVHRIQEKALGKAENMLDSIEAPSDLKLIVEAVDRAAITLKVAERHAPKAVTAIQVNDTKEVKSGVGELYKVINE